MDVYDIVIVGGGAVGLSLLRSLSKMPDLKVLVLESRAISNCDPLSASNQDRFIVLSNSTRKFFQELGCFDVVHTHCTPIDTIEVSAQGQYGTSQLKASDLKTAALGYVISLYQLEKILETDLSQDSLCMGAKLTQCEWVDNEWLITYTQNSQIKTIQSKCLIGADGQHSLVRTQNQIDLKTKTYGHQALIGTVNVQSHTYPAFERFLKKGAIAFLPLKDQRAVFIWTVPEDEAQQLFQKEEAEFLNILQDCFGYRLGKLSNLQGKKVFPLTMTQADVQGKAYQSLLLMGTSALSLHPIGAQGLNLSLRNIGLLAKLLNEQKDCTLCFKKLIQQYLEKIQQDQKQTIWMTDKLASYVSGGPFPLPLRALGILLFDGISPLKKMFTHLNTGLGVI